MPKSFKISDNKKGVVEEKEVKPKEEKKTQEQSSSKVSKKDSLEEAKKELEGKIEEKVENKDPKKESKKTEKEKRKKEKKETKRLKKEEKKKKKESSKKDIWKKFLFPVVAIFTLAGIGLFYYFGIYRLQPKSLSDLLNFDEMFISSKSDDDIFSQDLGLLNPPEEPRTEESPLNGLLFSKSEMDEMMNRPPVAVMINNHQEARPLSGLNSADIVIEANVESGITRLLGIFWSKAPAKVGPIRSLRQYYLEWASEFDPLIIYDGCAKTDDPRTNACGNVYSYDFKIIGTRGAWRSPEGGRVAPHNEYSSIESAWDYAKEVDWDNFPSSIQSLEFKRDAEIKDRGDKTTIKTVFHTRLTNGGAYDAEWNYDRSTNSYFREIGGSKDIDAETSSQVSAKVLILQKLRVVPSGDDKGRLITTTIDNGEAVVLQDGNAIDASWEKDSRTDRTKYYDSSGNPIKFNRGRIWISMIPHSDGEFDIIEQ